MSLEVPESIRFFALTKTDETKRYAKVIYGRKMIGSLNSSSDHSWENKAIEEAVKTIPGESPITFEDVSTRDLELMYVASATALVKGASDVLALDLRGKHSLVDYLVICTGNSERHARSVSEAIVESLRRFCGERPALSEGLREGNWVLLDYNSILVNIFDGPTRSFYALERLWSDAERKEFDPRVLAGVRAGS